MKNTLDYRIIPVTPFAQSFQHAALEFGQLIEKQQVVMRQRNLAGMRHTAAGVNESAMQGFCTPQQRAVLRGPLETGHIHLGNYLGKISAL